MPSRPVPFLLAALLLAPLAGCSVSIGGPGTLEADEVERFVRSGYAEQTGLTLEQLSCGEVKAEVGAPVRCSGVNSRDVKITIGGAVREVKDDRARYRWDVTRAVAPGSLFEGALGPLLQRQAQAPIGDIACPPEITVERGGRFTCTVAGATRGDRWKVAVVLTDGDGQFRVEGVERVGGGGGGRGAAGAGAATT